MPRTKPKAKIKKPPEKSSARLAREKASVYLESEIRTKLKIRAAEERREMSEIVNEALRAYL